VNDVGLINALETEVYIFPKREVCPRCIVFMRLLKSFFSLYFLLLFSEDHFKESLEIASWHKYQEYLLTLETTCSKQGTLKSTHRNRYI